MNDKITALCQTNMSESHALYQTLQTTKTENKNNCNPFQSSSSLSIRASFCICCVIYTFFLLFERLFLCFIQFGFSSRCLNFDKRRASATFKSNSTDLWWSVTRHPKGRIYQRHLSLKHKQMRGKFSKTSRRNLDIFRASDSILTININSTLWHEHE